MNFANVKSLTIPEGSVYRILSGSTVLWTKRTSPIPPGEHQLLYLMNGDDSSDSKQYGYGINTGITW